MSIFHKKIDIDVLSKAIAYLEEGPEVSPRSSDVPDYVLKPLDFFTPDYNYLEHYEKLQEKGITPDKMDMDNIRTMFTFFNRGERFSYGFTAEIINNGELLSVYRRLKELASTKKNTSITKSISGILFIVGLFAALCTINAYAAPNNSESNTLDMFPALGQLSDVMEKNLGTITTLYDGGMVETNEGHISTVSGGTVAENRGSIEILSAGHVGTNSGTIDSIRNTGDLGVNDAEGKITFVGTGNTIDRNYGEIQENLGEISENYGKISDNRGNVTMHGGTIENNYQNGRLAFIHKISGSGPIPPTGTVKNNKGTVLILGGTIKIEENTGSIEVSNATVTVDRNLGEISVGENAKLVCVDNMTDGLIRKTAESAKITCNFDNGRFYDETAVYYQVVFTGDDGKAAIDYCDYEDGNGFYTQAGSNVIFTLPFGYFCSDAMKFEMGGVDYWTLTANPSEGDTEIIITCQKTCDSSGHTFGEWETKKPATETDTGTKERTCSVCGYKETDTIPVLPHTHKGKLQSGVSETCTSSGVKAYYICSCNKLFEDEACSIEITNLNVWKSKGGNGYIAPAGHSFSTYKSNNDATCTADGTKTANCENGCGATDTIADNGSAVGHRYGEWVIVKAPTLDETGIKERTCSVCNSKERADIPVLTDTSYTNNKHSTEIVSDDEMTSTNISIAADQSSDMSKPVNQDISENQENETDPIDTTADKDNSDNTDNQINPMDEENQEDSQAQTIQNEPTNQDNQLEQPNPTEQLNPIEQPNTSDVELSQKNDNSHTLLLTSILSVGGGALVGSAVYVFKKKKRLNK